MVNKFSTIKERVVKFVEFKGVTKEIFFEKIGTTSANFRGNAKNTPLNSTVIANIFTEFPDLSLEWLFTGIGEMLRNDVQNSQNAHVAGSGNITQNQSKDTNNISNGNSIIGDNIKNCQNGSNKSIDTNALVKLLAEKDERIKEKDERIREKDERIKELIDEKNELKQIINELKHK